MLSKYVMPGNRLEIQAVTRGKYIDDTEKKKIYESQVYDILSEDRLEIYMPMEKTKLVLLPINTQYDICFYTSSGLYQCFATTIDRYKSDRKYLIVLELTSNLRKFQRREYYRLSCALEMNIRPLVKEEFDAVENKENYLATGIPLQRSVIVDISGGGVRFVGDYRYEPDSLINCIYHLVINGKDKEYNLVARILRVRELEDRPGTYEHRAQYIHIDTEEREEIIRFIFEEERKHRKKEKGI